MAFAIESRNGVNRAVVYHRPTGRLMRPSDHQMSGSGLGELDGILDTFKNLGSGIVKFATAGLYDPSKNRFYVPFSSGQMRNWAQGAVNTTTLGLVKTDKFFNSQTMKTIGTVAGGLAAAGTAAVVGRALYTTYGPGATSATGSSVDSGGLLNTGAKTVAATTTKATQTGSTSGSIFSGLNLDTVAKALDVTSKIAQVGGGLVAGGGASQQMMEQGGAPMMVMAPPQEQVILPIIPGAANTGLPVYDPGLMYGGGAVPMMVSGGGGGGGIGPMGSEFGAMDQGMMPVEDEWSPGIKLAVVGGGVILLYYLFKKK